MLLTFKTSLRLTQQQKEIIDKMSNEGRTLYNHYLSILKNQYDQNKKYISYYQQQSTLKDYKSDYLTFDNKKQILRLLHNNYKSFFSLIKTNKDLNPNPPKFRGYKYFFTISLVQDFIIKNNILKISYPQYKRLQIKLDYNQPIKNLECTRNKSKSQIKQIKIYKQKEKYFASIVYQRLQNQQKQIDYSKVLSIDLGKKNLLSVYDAQNNTGIVYSSKYLSKNQKYYDKRVDQLKSKRDKKKKHSIRFNQINKKIRNLNSKKKNQTKLALHRISKDLSKQNKTILIGQLTNLKYNILTKNRKLNRQMQNNWNLQTFIDLLQYKCKLTGNQVIKVNEAWTSKTCCKCGNINHDLTLSDRQYICDCGNKINRDINGAINIYKQFLGDYDPPLDIDNTSVSERFDWCNVNQMNRIYE